MTDYKLIPDPALMDLLKSGDHGAFAEFYNRFYSLLYVHAMRRLNDKDSATDLIQDIFTEFWEKRNQLQLRGSVSAYLYAMVRNRILDHFAKSKVIDKYLTSLGAFFDLDEVEADHKIRESQLQKLIENELAHLPETERRIFLMSREQHKSYREIALELDLSEEAVKSKMKRSLKVLRGRLGLIGYLMLLCKLF